MFAVGQVPPGTTRGRHAHRNGSQLLMCLSGRVRVELRWDGQSADVVLVPSRLLLIKAGV